MTVTQRNWNAFNNVVVDDDNDELNMSDNFELQDELQSLQDISSYEIPNEHDIHETDPGPLLQRTSTCDVVQVVSDHHVFQMPSTELHATLKLL